MRARRDRDEIGLYEPSRRHVIAMMELTVSSTLSRGLQMLTAEGRVSDEDQAIRSRLVSTLKERVPPEVWPRVEYFQPQVGCFNRCAFCSHSAGTEIWQLTERGLRNLLSRRSTLDRLHEASAPMLDDPQLNIVGFHYFTFNQLIDTWEWQVEKQGGDRRPQGLAAPAIYEDHEERAA